MQAFNSEIYKLKIFNSTSQSKNIMNNSSTDYYILICIYLKIYKYLLFILINKFYIIII